MAGVTSKVASIVEPINGNEPYEVLLYENGRVLHLENSRTDLLEKIEFAKENDMTINFETNADDVNSILDLADPIIDVTLESNTNSQPANTDDRITTLSNFEPTNLDSLKKAQEVMNTLNTKTQFKSQCFNRAHIWAKEMYDNFGINSRKILIYYTLKFRKTISGRWWFHIAPMLKVNGADYVVDRGFTRSPKTAEEWEKIFTKKMKGKRGDYRCKRITHVSEFYNEENMRNEYCNIHYTSMYYWGPRDAKNLEEKGIQKTKWVNWEIRQAAKEAFKKWKKVYKDNKVETE